MNFQKLFQGVLMTAISIAVISRVPALTDIVAPDWD
tara:strand:+ start:2354 stop:2461 length:108 start_codon:yes stop_codon:yes gene_type:complete